MFELVFFQLSTHAAPLVSQNTSNQTPLQMWVVPEKESSSPESKTSPAQKRHESAVGSVEHPEEQSPNEQSTSLHDSRALRLRSLQGALREMKGMMTTTSGGEGGFLSLRMRGARVFEPASFFNGIPLAGVHLGEQSFDLIPTALISDITAYPDAPPFGLRNMGLGGALNAAPCTPQLCYPHSGRDSSATSGILRAGSFRFLQGSASTFRSHKNSFVHLAAEHTSSLENYHVRNDNGTVSNKDDDFTEKRRNNDFSRWGTGISFEFPETTFQGILSGNVLGSHEDRGLTGAVGSLSSRRLTRNLGLADLKWDSLSAETGLAVEHQVFGLLSRSRSPRDGSLRSSQGIESSFANAGYQGKFTLPVEKVVKGTLGFGLFVGQDRTQSKAESVSGDNIFKGEQNGRRNEARVTLLRTAVWDVLDSLQLGFSADGFLSLAQSTFQFRCDESISTLQCEQKQNASDPLLKGTTFSLQLGNETAVAYMRLAWIARRPHLGELFGGPGGRLANFKLTEETSQKREMGISTRYLTAGIYNAHDQNLIFLQRAGASVAQYRNTESGQRMGTFASLESPEVFFSRVSLSYEYLNAFMNRAHEEPTRIPRSPEHTWHAGFDASQIPLAAFMSQSIYLGGYLHSTWQSAFYLDTANLVKLKLSPEVRTGVWATVTDVRSKGLWKALQVALDVENLLDDMNSRRTDVAGNDSLVEHKGYPGFPTPGRRIYLTLKAEI
jgi:hypothetical protein